MRRWPETETTFVRLVRATGAVTEAALLLQRGIALETLREMECPEPNPANWEHKETCDYFRAFPNDAPCSCGLQAIQDAAEEAA